RHQQSQRRADGAPAGTDFSTTGPVVAAPGPFAVRGARAGAGHRDGPAVLHIRHCSPRLPPMLTGLLGGALIGLAATVYLVATGRVAGGSGILAGAAGGG